MKRILIAGTGVLAVALTMALVAGGFAPVQAEPREWRTAKAGLGAVQARLAAADHRLRRLDVDVQRAAEEYDTARHRLARAHAIATATRLRRDGARRAVAERRAAVGRYAARDFQHSHGLREIDAYLNANGPRTLLDRKEVAATADRVLSEQVARLRAADVVARITDRRARAALLAYHRAAGQAKAMRDRAEAARQRQVEQIRVITAERNALLARLAELRRISIEAAKRRQAELAAERVRRAEQYRQAERPSRVESGRSPAAGTGARTGTGVSSSRGRLALDFAMRQLGEPYVFGAAGPRTWDCSGLTRRAWQQSGIEMPHFARGQYWQSTRIGIGDLRPGDLVFWADDPADSNTIHHVALYLGNGRIVHAPRPGRDVEIRSMWYMGTPSHYARPR